MDRNAGPLPEADLEQLRKLSPWRSISKQERDYVGAALILKLRLMTERSLRTALRNWTPFGTASIGECLLAQGLMDEDAVARLNEEGERYFASLTASPSWKYMPHTIGRRTSLLLEQLDPSGRVAKIFGLSRLPRAVVGNELRTSRSRFKLIRKLGQGGLGTVWLAVDSTLNRYVAVKEILGHAERNSAAVARFRREAEITGRLDHPGIVPVHALSDDDDGGRLFYVMRFLGNDTLEDAIREYHERRESGQASAMDLHRLLSAFVSVCQAIAYAHSRRVMHRDLKPQNIALDSFSQVIVLDWGLAKSLDMDDPQVFSAAATEDKPADNLDVTVAGQVTGTPIYMAPEQAAGRIDEIDERTDIYGLGAILFCILTGYAPHELSQESLAADSGMPHLLEMIVDGPRTNPRKLNPSTPPALEAICLKAMAPDRYARYQTASALAEDVQRWMADEPTSVLTEPVSKRIRRWSATHSRLSWFLALLAAATLVSGVFVGFSTYQYRLSARQLRLEHAADITRDLRGRLSYEVETLSDHVRLISSLPAIQGVLDPANRGKQDESSLQRLNQTLRQLLDVDASYLAISLWVKFDESNRITSRIERSDATTDQLRSDYTEFFGRHLPAITVLPEGYVYLGMPGRLAHNVEGHPEVARKALQESKEAVGNDLVSGAAIFDPATKERLGGVLIECDLERILRDHLFTASSGISEIDLTDRTGRPMMRFTREKGLFALNSEARDQLEASAIRPFFTATGSSDVLVLSPILTAAKVPLRGFEEGEFMGLIVRFRTERNDEAD